MNKKLLYTLVILVAVSAAAKSYEYFSQPAAMLVLQVKTFEKGTRSINVIDSNGNSHLLKFEMGNDLGEPSFYPIDLPRVIPQKISIAPLAARGNFEIDRITIRNEQISYSWDSQGLCTSKKLQHGKIRQETCGDGQPEMTIANDLQLLVTKIPSSGFGPDMVRGIAAGTCSFFAILLAGFWLCRPVNIDNKSGRICMLIGRGCWLLVLSVYLAQLLAIWQYSADLPFWEEWEYFLPEGLPNGLSWDWLFNFAGYHRVVPTKLMAWLNLQLFGLDFKLQKLFNYFIFVGLLLTLVSLKNRMIGKKEFMLFPAFLLFLLSPIMYENHSNSYQSQIHLVLIFTLMAMFHVYDDSFRAKSVAVFLICLVAAINTFSAGMTIAAVLLPCWAIFVLFRMVD